jgi:hypothetical protein
MEKTLGSRSPDGWGIDIWFLIETAMSGYQTREIFLGTKEHTSFEDYREDVGKLSRTAEQVEFTILKGPLSMVGLNRIKMSKRKVGYELFIILPS